MAQEGTIVVSLQDNFYRDSFNKLLLLITALVFAIVLLGMTSVYLYTQKPRPIAFRVSEDWRVMPPVPVQQPYVSVPELSQWVSDTLMKIFAFDFVNYKEQVQAALPYFTEAGWKVFLNQLNNYANGDDIAKRKLFVNGVPGGAPSILNQGVLSGRYAWWVEMPLEVRYIDLDRSWSRVLTLQLLVVRVPTLNNLAGIAIDNVIVSKGAGGL